MLLKVGLMNQLNNAESPQEKHLEQCSGKVIQQLESAPGIAARLTLFGLSFSCEMFLNFKI